MKYDSHVRLTNAALKLLATRCPRPNACSASWLKAYPTVWVQDGRNSNPIDNWGFGVASGASYILQLQRIFAPDLPAAVGLVDVQTYFSLGHPEGQKYHFMRASDEPHKDAYDKGVGFVFSHTLQFVN